MNCFQSNSKEGSLPIHTKENRGNMNFYRIVKKKLTAHIYGDTKEWKKSRKLLNFRKTLEERVERI